jgi:hypothetical protein
MPRSRPDRSAIRAFSLAPALLLACLGMHGQQSIGSLKTAGAEINGLVTVSEGRAVIGAKGAVIAGSQPADIALQRGGQVRVCASSSVHLSQPTAAVAKPPLLVALDRGAIEIKLAAEKTDSILTADLRFELSDAAPIDIRMRLTANGDTCVDNSGKDAPILHVTETFGSGAYFIRPGQRVLFEHGSLREVVDHESSNCGCPRGDDLVLAGNGPKGNGKVTEAARQNPFPEAVSQGLAQPETPQAPPAQEHVQVSTALNYSGASNSVSGPPGQTTSAASAAAPASATAPSPASPATASRTVPSVQPAASTPAPVAPVASAPATEVHIESAAPPARGPNPFRAIGHFFRRLFGAG